jgi:putative membrane protein
MWWNGSWTWMGQHWWWFMPFGGLWLVIVLVAVFAALMLRSPHRGPRSLALDLLEQRYARGEIGRDEYLEKRKDLTGS